MGIESAVFPPPLSSPALERELARCIEAGVYAQWLLDNGHSHHCPEDLRRLVVSKDRAWETLWLSNLRLVAKQSHRVARRHCLPFDDVFQDGCLGLAEALMRFDWARGWRFSTLAHEYVQRFVVASAARRAGALDGPGRRHRLRILLRQRTSALSAVEQRHVPIREVARRSGVSLAAAGGAWTVITSIDDAGPHQLANDGGFDDVEAIGLDFLELLAGAGELLRLRYGVGGPCHTQAEVALRFGVSPSTVARMERRALARARAVLEADQCRLPGAGR